MPCWISGNLAWRYPVDRMPRDPLCLNLTIQAGDMLTASTASWLCDERSSTGREEEAWKAESQKDASVGEEMIEGVSSLFQTGPSTWTRCCPAVAHLFVILGMRLSITGPFTRCSCHVREGVRLTHVVCTVCLSGVFSMV